MHIEVPRVPQDVLSAPQSPKGEPASEQIREQVEAVQALQIERQGVLNSKLSVKQIDKASQQLIDRAIEQFGLSARAYYRILKLARSIADLAGSQWIMQNYLAQAVQLRSFDRRN